jgi:hypothetical protein
MLWSYALPAHVNHAHPTLDASKIDPDYRALLNVPLLEIENVIKKEESRRATASQVATCAAKSAWPHSALAPVADAQRRCGVSTVRGSFDVGHCFVTLCMYMSRTVVRST